MKGKVIALLALAVASVSANAAMWEFSIQADGSQVVPGSGSGGTGTGTLVYDDQSNLFTLDMSLTGIDAPGPVDITSTAIFAGAPGSSGTQIDNLSVLCNWFGANGSYELFAPVFYAFPEEHEQDLLNGNVYLQIATNARPGGEIRGQFTPVPEPASMAILGLGALALLRKRRMRR
jgi:hypothetical protein